MLLSPSVILQVAGSLYDVPFLSALVTADKKQHQPVALYGKALINRISALTK